MEPSAAVAAAPLESPSRLAYVVAALEATRPHFFAFPIGAVFAGIASAEMAVPPWTLGLAALIAGGGWGSGQLLNDVLDKDADAIDAPHRPAVRGLLPPKRTVALALGLGLSLLGLLITLTPHGLLLGVCSMGLILTYNRFKAVPLAGNISHGLLMSVAALIGVALARPDRPLLSLIQEHGRVLSIVGSWSALYLLANYEKDAKGDAAAGYRTLPHIIGIRWSSWLRLLLIGISFQLALPLMSSPLSIAIGGLSAALLMVSAGFIGAGNSTTQALRWYRATVHGGTLGMLAFGGDILPPTVLIAACLSAALLTEAAFQKSPNP